MQLKNNPSGIRDGKQQATHTYTKYQYYLYQSKLKKIKNKQKQQKFIYSLEVYYYLYTYFSSDLTVKREQYQYLLNKKVRNFWEKIAVETTPVTTNQNFQFQQLERTSNLSKFFREKYFHIIYFWKINSKIQNIQKNNKST
eukprot:TRINITY_DN17049_c0_g1_i1.p1 TRINITY_DN17049_c0_g1~~TRINITY_DN17049_c0_g1_i1.p1  ORF type:complete len:141 (-),score=5.26 TRINITY_DN17049_c0_g1_i1:115-537(-)